MDTMFISYRSGLSFPRIRCLNVYQHTIAPGIEHPSRACNWCGEKFQE